MEKSEIKTIAQKMRITNNILDEMLSKDAFLLAGHKNPDTDCIASLAACALLLRKLQKEAAIFLPGPMSEQFNYLLAICKYNGITVIYGRETIPDNISVMIILDTPKPEMIAMNSAVRARFDDPAVRKIEIDHHLETDAAYAGDEGYCLVSAASSTCELIGCLAFKLITRRLEGVKLEDFFTRNIALALLTGVVGDSHMGKYLKTSKERRIYNAFTTIFDRLLIEKTIKNSRNLASMEDIFDVIQRFSVQEKRCFDSLVALKERSRFVAFIYLGKEASAELFTRYGVEPIVNISKAVADTLAEESGNLGMVVYHDDKSQSDYVQFRLRRSSQFGALDLRTILVHCNISNGGGHPGAIGFRVKEADIPDSRAYLLELLARIDQLVEASR